MTNGAEGREDKHTIDFESETSGMAYINERDSLLQLIVT